MNFRRRLEVTPLEDRVVPTPVITVAAIANATEGGSAGTFRVSRSEGTSSLSLTFNVQGTAELYTDHGDAEAPYQIVIGLNQSYVDVTIGATNDSTSEPTETVVLNILSGTGYTVGSPASATIYIFDNDTPVVSVTATDTAEASATGGFSLTRIGNLASALTVNYAVDGTAEPEDDYEELAGSVQFAANADRVEIPVVAFGDNTAEDPETVELTLSSGSGYTIDTGADEATVTIADQPQTVSVSWVADGTEGGGSGTLRFTRAGDLTDELVVTYDVGGTATSGTDFTALSGSVTFDEDEEWVDVTVIVTNDGSTEATETVTVTLDEDEDYLLGNDSDTLFIWDIDGSGTIWVSTGSTDWNTASNWSGNAVPTSSDHVYFIGSYSNVNCTNAGSGLSTLAGMHFQGAYSGTVTLANALSVGTYEQLTGTLNQPTSKHLTITDVMVWTGGTLNGITDSNTQVNIDGAVGRIDPPDTGSVATGSTLRVINGAAVNLLPGAVELLGGSGLYIAAQVKAYTRDNVDVWIKNPSPTTVTGAKIDITEANAMRVVRVGTTDIGYFTSDVPIQNAGDVTIESGIHVTVKGNLGGGNGPSFSQSAGSTVLHSTSTIDVRLGGPMVMSDGLLTITGGQENLTARIAGELMVEGGIVQMEALICELNVQGNVKWTGGQYKPRVDGTNENKRDRWCAHGTFEIGTVGVNPFVWNEGQVSPGMSWEILRGMKGSMGNAPTVGANNYEIVAETMGMEKFWTYRRKNN